MSIWKGADTTNFQGNAPQNHCHAVRTAPFKGTEQNSVWARVWSRSPGRALLVGGALGQRRRGPRTLRREPPCKDLEVSVQERNSTSDSDSQPKRKECSLSACLSVAESVASEAHFCRGSDGGPAPPQVASALSLREEDQGPVSLRCVGGIGLGSRQSAALCFALRHRLPRELDSACVCVLFLPENCRL